MNPWLIVAFLAGTLIGRTSTPSRRRHRRVYRSRFCALHGLTGPRDERCPICDGRTKTITLVRAARKRVKLRIRKNPGENPT